MDQIDFEYYLKLQKEITRYKTLIISRPWYWHNYKKWKKRRKHYGTILSILLKEGNLKVLESHSKKKIRRIKKI